MPKKQARKMRRPNYRRKRKQKIQSTPSGFPSSKVTKLRWCEVATLGSVGGALASTTLRANGLDDITLSGTDHHNPYGFDQWAKLYDHYKVLGSKLTVAFVPQDTTNNPCTVGVYLSDNSVVSQYTDVEGFMEAKRGQYRTLTPDSSAKAFLKSHLSAKRFFNVKDVKDVGKLGASTNETQGYPDNPTEGAYYKMIMQPLVTGDMEVKLQITLDFIVLFQEPKNLPQS